MPRLAPFLGAALAACAATLPRLSAQPAALAPKIPILPDRLFHFEAFRAEAGGRADNTAAFRQAVAAVKAAGGGTLEVPAGIYLTGPFALCDRINLRLDAGAVIRFTDRPSAYRSGGGRLQPELAVNGRHDVMISGAGVLDGQGAAWWPAARAMRDPVTGRQYNGHTTPRPPIVVFRRCERVRVEGITLRNSPALNLGFDECREVTVEGVAILNPADSPNTDGIDPKGCQNVLIAHCHIDTGDDCIAAGGRGPMVEENVLITDCAFLHGHGCSIGSDTSSGVRDFAVTRCTFDGTTTGIRLKSAPDRGGPVERLTYADLVMRGVAHAITINSDYEGTTIDTTVHLHPPSGPLATRPRWRGIVFRNVTATGGTGSIGVIVGLPEAPVEDVVFDHVSVQAPEGLKLAFVRRLVFHDVHLDVAHGPPVAELADVSDFQQAP